MKRIARLFELGARWVWTFCIVCTVVGALIAASFIYNSLWTENARRSIENRRAHSLEVMVAAGDVEGAVLNGQRVLRAMMMRDESAGDVVDALSNLRSQSNRLAMMTRPDWEQTVRTSRLHQLVLLQAATLPDVREAVLAGRMVDARRIAAHGYGDSSVAEARSLVTGVMSQERRTLAKLAVDARAISRSFEEYVYVIGVLSMFVVLVAAVAIVISLSFAWSSRIEDLERRYAERMRIAHEATGAGTWEMSPRNGLVWSAETYTLYGRDQALGPPGRDEWLHMVHPDDLASCPWTSDAVERSSFESTYRIAARPGIWRWIVSRGFSFESDGTVRLVGMDVDVTEQVANRDELARLNALLSEKAATDRRDREIVFESTGDLMAIIGADGRLASVNPAWSKVLGWLEEDLVDRPISDFVADGSAWCIGESHFSAKMRSAMGDGRVIEWSVALDSMGRMIAAGRDATDQRHAEARLREAEQSIRQMQKIESVGQMTGGIAHDFNNMLTPIFGYLEMIGSLHAGDERTARMVNVALQSAERARILVSKLLSFARRQQLEYRVVDVVAVVSDMADLIDKAIAGLGVDLALDAPSQPMCVRVDPNQFEMVLMNLAVNARDAMPGGGTVRISVRAASGSEAPRSAMLSDSEHVVVSVSDDGIGMDGETLERAIEPFYSTKGVGKGTGLGLSMAHGMAAQSGGGLVLESEPGKGTAASVWLPRVDCALLGDAIPEVEIPAVGPTESFRILLVDDEDVVRSSVEQMLVGAGHRVVCAASGAEALAIMSDGEFDMIVTDHIMPSMTGMELVARARRIKPDVPVLIVSGYTELADRKDVSGVFRLAKPFTWVRLASAVRRTMSRA